MSESMPGTMAVFGAAYQNMLAAQGKGGGLTGQAAVAALLDAVPTGQVRSSELLPFVSEEMQRRAAPKLDVARETSQGWQGRLANQRTGWTKIASEAGVEEGQRNFARFFTQWMNENRQIPQKFGEMWKNISEQFVIAGGFGSLLRETLGGKDTIIKEWLGEEKTAQFAQDFERLSSAVKGAVKFLGLMTKEDKDETTVWEKVANKSAALVGVPGALAEGDLPRAGENLTSLFDGGGEAYVKRMPHLRAIRGIFNSIANPERDDERERPRLTWQAQPFGFPLLAMQKPPLDSTLGEDALRGVLHNSLSGVELLTQGAQNGVSDNSPTLVIENLSVTANSSDPEDLAERFIERVEDSYRRAMMGLNR